MISKKKIGFQQSNKNHKKDEALRGGIEPPRHFRTTGFPGLRPTARLPQQKVYPICMQGIFLMVSLSLELNRCSSGRSLDWLFSRFFIVLYWLIGFYPAPGIGARLQENGGWRDNKPGVTGFE